MNQTTSPFKFIRNDIPDERCEPYDLFEAEFQLKDDGCPGSEQFLVVRLITHGEGVPEAEILVRSATGDHPVCSADADFDNVARALYGVARVVTTRSLQLV